MLVLVHTFDLSHLQTLQNKNGIQSMVYPQFEEAEIGMKTKQFRLRFDAKP